MDTSIFLRYILQIRDIKFYDIKDNHLAMFYKTANKSIHIYNFERNSSNWIHVIGKSY